MLQKIPSNKLNKIWILHLLNIGNLVEYKLLPKSNTSTFDINEVTIFDKLPTAIMNNDESIKSENFGEKERDASDSQELLDQFNQKVETGYNNCSLVNDLNENIINYFEDEEKTKEQTQEEKIKIDEKMISKISFPDSIIKFSSSSIEEINDTLIFNYEGLINSENMKIIIELLTKNDFCKDKPSLIFFENNYYIPIPDWAYSVKSLDLYNLSLAIILLILILIISQISYDNNNTSYIKLDDIYMQNNKKINEFKEDPKITKIIFTKNFLVFISNQITESYVKSCKLKDVDKIKKTADFYNQLIEIKEYICKYETSQDKLEKLFEKTTFYSSSDILNSYHYTFVYFRKFLLNCSSYQYLTNRCLSLYKNISNNNDFLKPYKEECVSDIRKYIFLNLGQYFYIDCIEYGSSAMGLEVKTSDRDIIIFFKEKYISYSISILQFCNLLYSLLRKIPYLTVEIIHLQSIGQLIKINYRYKFQEIKIDITFTKDKKYVRYLEEMINFVKSDLEKYPKLRPLALIIKSILIHNSLNIVYKGGLNSLSVYFMAKHIIITYEEENPSLGRLVFLFLEKYSKYDFTYGIDEKGREFPYDQKNLEDSKKRFIIVNPIKIKDIKDFTNTIDDNIAFGCFNPNGIIDLFKKLLK